jgi:hypothetical protein
MSTQKPADKKLSNLEAANEIFKAAFQIQKQRISEKLPHLSDTELQQKTADYFRALNERLKK